MNRPRWPRRHGLVLLVAAITAAVPTVAGADDDPSAGGTTVDLRHPGPFSVGVKTVVLEDTSRSDSFAGGNRTLVVDIWYPSGSPPPDRPKTRFAEFFGKYRSEAERVLRTDLDDIEKRFQTLACRDVSLKSGPKYPLILFSHGNGGFRHQNVFQMDHLASHGYLVASPDHTGNSRLAPLPEKAVFYNRRGRTSSAENRPKDVSFLIDWFVAESGRRDSWLRGAVDADRIGVLGHSFGGYTACSAAARDPRIKAIVPMTLAVAGLGVPPAHVPTMVFIGQHDRTIQTVGNLANRAYYQACPADKFLVNLRRGGHFTFCEMGVLDPDFGDGIGRGEGLNGKVIDFVPVPLAKEIQNAYTLAFFERYLRGRDAAAAFLAKNHYPEEVEYLTEKATSEPPRRARF